MQTILQTETTLNYNLNSSRVIPLAKDKTEVRVSERNFTLSAVGHSPRPAGEPCWCQGTSPQCECRHGGGDSTRPGTVALSHSQALDTRRLPRLAHPH